MTVEYVQTQLDLDFETQPVVAIPDLLSPQETERIIEKHLAEPNQDPRYYQEADNPQKEGSYKGMSLSHLRLIHTVLDAGIAPNAIANSADQLYMTEPQLIQRVQQTAGRRMIAINLEIEKFLRLGMRPHHIGMLQADLSEDHQRLVRSIATPVITRYERMLPTDPTVMTRDVWALLRQYYGFWKVVPHSTKIPLVGGTRYSPDEIENIWNSQQQKNFEDSLLEFLSSTSPSLLSTPKLGKEINRLAVFSLDNHAVQATGMINHLLTYMHEGHIKKWIVVTDRFIDSDDDPTLFQPSIASEMKALIFAHCLTHGNFQHGFVDHLPPSPVLVLERLLDWKEQQIFYRQIPTSGPSALQTLKKLQQYIDFYLENSTALNQLKQILDAQAVTPHLAHPDEQTRPAQYAMAL